MKGKFLLAALLVGAVAGCGGAAGMEADQAHSANDDSVKHQLAVTQYLIDTAGFHAMDEELEETGEIEPGYAGTVNRVAKLVERTAWPDELSAEVGAFRDALAGLAQALEDDDSDQAAEMAAEAHSTQHDLSHAIDNWIDGGEHSEDGHESAGDHDQ